MISVSYSCKRGRKHCENTFSQHASMFPLPDQEEVLHRKTLNSNIQSGPKISNIFRTSKSTANSSCGNDFRQGTLFQFIMKCQEQMFTFLQFPIKPSTVLETNAMPFNNEPKFGNKQLRS